MPSIKQNKLKPTNPIIIRKISGNSMYPELKPRSIVIATTWFRKLKVGDLIIFNHQNIDKIKRISAIKYDAIFVTGDNSDSSTDSRAFGWINLDNVIAKVVVPHS